VKKDFLIFLKHILVSIELIEDYVKDTTDKKFLSNLQQRMLLFEESKSSEKLLKTSLQNLRIDTQRSPGERSLE
jgi:hypothetical protein